MNKSTSSTHHQLLINPSAPSRRLRFETPDPGLLSALTRGVYRHALVKPWGGATGQAVCWDWGDLHWICLLLENNNITKMEDFQDEWMYIPGDLFLYTYYNYLYTVPIVCSRATFGFRHLDLIPTLDLSPSKNTLQPLTARPPRRKPFKNSIQLNLKLSFQKSSNYNTSCICFSYICSIIQEEYHLEANSNIGWDMLDWRISLRIALCSLVQELLCVL